ncbi:MAG: pseudouridine synthase [Rhizobiaceae bacterium]
MMYTSPTKPPPFNYDPPTHPVLTVLHEEPEFLILSKQSGLLSVPGKSEEHADCLETRVKNQFPDALTVHRLDRGTSGILIMARSKAAHRHLSMQFEKRQTEKAYIAEVWGLIEEDTGTIDLPLRCDWPNRPKQHVDFENGKPSLTHWEVLARGENSTRLKLTPITGRSHQLRVHLMSIGHPILGDAFYAQGEAFGDAYHAADRLHLHAETLSFFHPNGGERVYFTDSCPF